MAPDEPTRVIRRPLMRARWRSQPGVVLALGGLLAVLAVATALGLVLLWPSGDAQIERPGGPVDTLRGRVVETREGACQVPDAEGCITATVRLLEGPDEGDEVDVLVGEIGAEAQAQPGDVVRLVESQVPEGQGEGVGGFSVAPYALNDFERRGALAWLLATFVAVVVVAGRWRGMRALAGLAASLVVVVMFIVPALLEGSPPVLVALVGALAVMLLTIPLAHGLGQKTIAASLGTALALLLTLLLATAFTELAHLTGFASDEVAYLRASVEGLSLRGLLLAGVVIGALGVLDDVTVTQASTVLALRRANPQLGPAALFANALSVGRDHITATVNTLVLAYVGASLPGLLVFSVADVSAADAINGEVVAADVVATLVGSIGLIAAMPLTTALAVVMASRMSATDVAPVHAHTH